MRLIADRFHCPRCKGRLNTITADMLGGTQAGSLFCTQCEAIVPAQDGIPDFTGGRTVIDTDPQALAGNPFLSDEDATQALDRLRAAAADRWPAGLGDVLELGCGGGRLTLPLLRSGTVRSIVAADSGMEALRACRDGLTRIGRPETVTGFVRLSLQEDVLRDATFDTVIGGDALTRAGDPRALLAMAHRVLRPGGRAAFIVPNRRYMLAFCRATAQALVLRRAREEAWSDPARMIIHMLGLLHRRAVHHGNGGVLNGLRDRNLFHTEELVEAAQEAGFLECALASLDPGGSRGDSVLRLCQAAGVDEAFAAELAPFVVSAGAPYFDLLARQDAAPTMLLWLTKGVGPALRSFTAAPKPPPVPVRRPEAALGGAPPRWSIETTAQETPEGIQLTVDGWCLVNADVMWLRLVIGDVIRAVPLGLPRPDVHDVLNRQGFYHPLNALCGGLRGTLLFDNVHAQDGQCAVRIEVALANGVVVQAPASRPLPLNETVTLAQ